MTALPNLTDEQHVKQLNEHCHCPIDKAALRAALQHAEIAQLLDEREHLFSDAIVFISEQTAHQQQALIDAIERVIALPAYQAQVLATAPDSAQFQPKAAGVFFGYDFHLKENQPQLIEINSNAGGALVNVLLASAQAVCCTAHHAINRHALTDAFMAMFLNEWRLERGAQPLKTIAIVDQQPSSQYMLPEFLLFQQLFQQHGIHALICDASELRYRAGKLWHDDTIIDLVYNRLTDFELAEPPQHALREAYMANATVLTPHHRAHALYANKKNLTLLSDDAALRALNVDEPTRAILHNGIAQTVCVHTDEAENLWATRKHLFFKPEKGYGSKAAYRGDKLTRRVFSEILQGEYVAQQLVQPSERQLYVAGQLHDFKVDLRNYVYQGQTQLRSARLYQGQTTNFRTPHGGFARVVVADHSER